MSEQIRLFHLKGDILKLANRKSNEKSKSL